MAITIMEHQHLLYRRILIIDLHGTIITVTVTSTAHVVDEWIASTLQLNRAHLNKLVVGIGVQWAPGPRDTTPASTLQLCVGRRCLIYQLDHKDYYDVPMNLQIFLRHPCNTFVGFRTFWYKKKLWNAGLDLRKHPLDIKMHARIDDNSESIKTASFPEIVQRCLGISGVCMKEEISSSDWSVLKLRDEQVLQAALVAYCSFQIGKNLKLWEIQRVWSVSGFSSSSS